MRAPGRAARGGMEHDVALPPGMGLDELAGAWVRSTVLPAGRPGAMVAPPMRAFLVPTAIVLLATSTDRALVVRVTDARDGHPLQNAEVVEQESGVRRMTNAAGEARFTLADGAAARLRVRQLGYQFIERRVAHRAGSLADTVELALSRAAVTLPTTQARGSSTCATDVDSVSTRISLAALEQLRFAAEQYDRFRREYPFDVTLLRRTVLVGQDGRPSRMVDGLERKGSEDWDEPYKPGRVLRRHGAAGFSVAILFVTTLADSTFWETHCLVARRVEAREGRRLLPLEFAPSPTLREPDWKGVAWLDSATSALHRVDFQLANLDDQRLVRRLEGYITFSYPSPAVALPDTVIAGWWTRPPDDGVTWGTPGTAQMLHVTKVEYRETKP